MSQDFQVCFDVELWVGFISAAIGCYCRNHFFFFFTSRAMKFFFLSHRMVCSSATQGLTALFPFKLVGVAQSNPWVLFWKCQSIQRHLDDDDTNPKIPPEPSPRDRHYQPGVHQQEEGERDLLKDCKSNPRHGC